jgi:predicted lipoprotein with Yx(FWY)xxD motif
MNNVTRTTAPVIKATVFLGLAALLVAGCASKKSNSAATSSAPATTAAIAAATAAGTPATSAAATSAAAVAPAAASGAVGGGSAAVAPGPAAVDVKTGPLGAYLTDATGHTLYLFTPDTSSTSTCYGQCVAYWPPLLTSSAPQAGSGAAASLLGTTKRTDGTMQVTYKNHPLYFFKGDKSAGDMTGQGTQGTWFLVSPAGKQLGSAPAPKASSSKPAAATPSASASKSSAAAGGGWS